MARQSAGEGYGGPAGAGRPSDCRVRNAREHSDRRGQSSVLGAVLILGVVIGSLTIVAAIGGMALLETQDELSTARAQKVMTQFDSQSALVALGSTRSREIRLAASGGGGYAVDGGAGWIRVNVTNVSSGGDPTRVMRTSLGAVVYQRDGVEVAYQGGGVWRERGGEAVMVSPPEFHYRGSTLTLPVISVEGDGTVGGRVTVRRLGVNQTFPNRTLSRNGISFTNPLRQGKVNVTVKSDYYRAWGRFFERRTDGEVAYDDSSNTVTLTLVTPLEKRTITSATASLAADGSFVISGSAKSTCGSDAYTNSYNSSIASCYAQTPGSDGDIVYGNDVDLDQGSGTDDIHGDVVAGQSVIVATGGGGSPMIYGNISYTDTCSPSASACRNRIASGSGGVVRQIDGVETTGNINGVVRSRLTEIRSDNDNGATGNVSGEAIDWNSGVAVLGSGEYYVEQLHMDADETLVLNTTGGDVTVAIEGDIDMEGSGSGGARIEVIGDGVAKVYVGGNSTFTNGDGWDLFMGKNAMITNPGQDAPQFRLYGKSDFDAQIGTSGGNLARYVGVIYAPPGVSGTGEVVLEGGEIFGGILTGTTEIVKGSIHYDEALQSKKIISRGTNVLRITYLHVSDNSIRVSDAG